VREEAGAGIEGRRDGTLYRLGRPAWAQGAADGGGDDDAVLLTRNGEILARFVFTHPLRPDASGTVAALKQSGFGVEIVSGDHDRPVETLARALDAPYRARVTPAEKVGHITRLAQNGRKVLMVGDGLNDAPALMAAHASMAPASAADVGRNAADFVFLRPSLSAVPEAIRTARRAAVLVRQNMTLAVVYNIIAVPIAIAGYVTPLVAAIAMSASSVLVVANALRLAPGSRL
jgi:Cu2+-exporting ATPase